MAVILLIFRILGAIVDFALPANEICGTTFDNTIFNINILIKFISWQFVYFAIFSFVYWVLKVLL
jgi:hypothetical protein